MATSASSAAVARLPMDMSRAEDGTSRTGQRRQRRKKKKGVAARQRRGGREDGGREQWSREVWVDECERTCDPARKRRP